MYEFIWSEFCDWYIELTKARLYGEDLQAKSTALYVLENVLEKSLRLLHPFMPFLTEVIRQNLPNAEGSIMLVDWFEGSEADEVAENQMNKIIEVIKVIRNLKNEIGVESRKKSKVILKISNAEVENILKSNINYISELAAAEPVNFATEKPEHALAGVVEGVEIFLPLKDLIDTEKEITRLTKELEKLRKGIAATEGKLRNKSFVEKAPAEVVQIEKEKLATTQEKISSVESRIEQLKNL